MILQTPSIVNSHNFYADIGSLKEQSLKIDELNENRSYPVVQNEVIYLLVFSLFYAFTQSYEFKFY